MMAMATRHITRFATALSIAAMTVAGGCAGYTLQGRVTEGDISYAAVLDQSDSRLSGGRGIPGVQVALETDPGRLKREFVGESVTDGDGNFSIRVARPGAGILLYDVGIEARRKGYEGVRQSFRLPPKGKRVFITLRPGPDTLTDEESLMERYERFR